VNIVVVGIVLLLTVLRRVTGRFRDAEGDLGEEPPTAFCFFSEVLLESEDDPELELLPPVSDRETTNLFVLFCCHFFEENVF